VRDEDVDPLYSSEQLQRLGEITSEVEAVAEILWEQAVDALAAATQMIAVAGQVEDRLRQTELWAENLDGDDLVQMYANDGYVIYWQANSRDAEQRLTGFRQGNGMVTTRDYDTASGNLLSIQSGFNFGANIRELEYHYDLAGNVVSRHDRLQEINETFSYDNLDRLTTNTLHGELNGYNYSYSTSYEYDRTGNLIYKSDVGHYTYGSANRNTGNAGPGALISAGENHTDYIYDRNGNLRVGGGRNFDWTSYNKPKRLSRGVDWTEFSYGPDRARYQKRTSDGETTTYIGKLYEELRQGTTVTHKNFIYTEDGVAAIHIKKIENGVTRSRETRYLHTDALGSVDTITDGVGVIVDRMSYDPFGMRRHGSWRHDLTLEIPTLTNRGFTGHEHVDSLGIIHMNGRIYDPELGRFLSADPTIQNPFNSQSHNRYSYVLNNPLKYTDPSGYFFKSLMRGFHKFMKRYGRVVVAIGAAWVTGGVAYGVAYGLVGSSYGVLAVAASGAVGGFVAGYVTSGTKQGAFKGAVVGAFSAVFAHAIGSAVKDGSMAEAFGEYAGAAANTFHGISQGTISAAAGGDFKSGFLGAFIGHAAGAGAISKIQGGGAKIFARTMIAAVAGGVAAKLGGGKFANGAVSAAFSHLFNSESEKILTFEDVDNRIWRYINSNPGKVVDIAHAELTVMMTGELSGLNLSGFLYEYDAMNMADSIFFGYAEDRFNVLDGPLMGNYKGSDISYYYTGFVAAAHDVSLIRMNAYISIYNTAQFDRAQIPVAKKFAKYGYDFYMNNK
jgi:RHS repeat-associated protein